MSQSHAARRQNDSPAAVRRVRELMAAARVAQRDYTTFSQSWREAR